MVKYTDFELSRIYASGWTAGRKGSFDDKDDIVSLVDVINPYLSGEERERWGQGFKDFMARCGSIR